MLAFAETTQSHTAEIKEIRRELRTLSATVERLDLEFNHLRKDVAREHENVLLRLENAMLRFERRLPSPRSDEKE